MMSFGSTPHRLVLLALILFGTAVTARAQSETPPTTFPSNASLGYPASLHENDTPQRIEPGLDDRQQRAATSTARTIALVPVRLLQAPLWLLNYPLEHWLVRRHPPAPVQRLLHEAQLLLHKGYGFRYGGFGVGSGIGGGISYRALVPGASRTYAKTFVGATFNGYQQYYLQLDRRFGQRTTLNGRVQFLDQPRIEFYGIGLHTDPADHSSYRLQASSITVLGQTRMRHAAFFGWDASYLHHKLRRGLTPGLPVSTEIFTADEVEGLRGTYHLLRGGLSLGWDGRDNPVYARHGTFALASGQVTSGLGTQSALTYLAWTGELQQFVPLPGARRTLAMRLHGVITDNRSADGHQIPVWSMQQLGGGHSVRTLPNFRYVDDDQLVANIEYRFPFWFLETPNGIAIDALTFFDVGTVLPDIRKMRQKDLRSGAGFGFRLVTRHSALLKLDIGWTSQNFKIDAGVRGPL
jgi:hypothetical protein